MAWKLEGTYFETCSCEVVCPCTASLALGADYDRCRVTLVFNITKGEVEGVDVGGLALAAVADTPKVMTDGNWRLGVFIDDTASKISASSVRGSRSAKRVFGTASRSGMPSTSRSRTSFRSASSRASRRA